MRVVRRAEIGTVHLLGLPAGEPAEAANSSSARGLASMARW
jgi:hypothetical protein